MLSAMLVWNLPKSTRMLKAIIMGVPLNFTGVMTFGETCKVRAAQVWHLNSYMALVEPS